MRAAKVLAAKCASLSSHIFRRQMKYSVITTIQSPTPAVAALVSAGRQFGMQLISIGDRKSPPAEWPAGSEFLSLDQQHRLKFRLGELLPTDHYGRKNLGYLLAISRGAELIFDTDDDNSPLSIWRPRTLRCEARPITCSGWVNVYRYFSSQLIWPRGFPLDHLHKNEGREDVVGELLTVQSPIQQGLVNGAPDVDAVWRLILNESFQFDDYASAWLAPGSWCPFNSQSTWWFPQAFSLLYLPSHVSFRMTDIWRSFVAQRCLWEIGLGIAFHSAESLQDRNVHNLMNDFKQEVPGYLENARIAEILEATGLASGHDSIGSNLYDCYESLVRANIVERREMRLVEAWLLDFEASQGAAKVA